MRKVAVVLLLVAGTAEAFTVDTVFSSREFGSEDGRSYRNTEAGAWSDSIVVDGYRGETGTINLSDSNIPVSGDYDSYAVNISSNWSYEELPLGGSIETELKLNVAFSEAVNFSMNCDANNYSENGSGIFAQGYIQKRILHDEAGSIWSTESVERIYCYDGAASINGTLENINEGFGGFYILTLNGRHGVYNVATSAEGDYTGEIVFTAAVPVPAAVWLFGSALAGLGWMRRKQAA